MAYDRDQAAHEFTRWSESYDVASSSGSCSARRTGR